MTSGSSGSEPGEPLLSFTQLPRYGQEKWSKWRKTGRQRKNPRPPRILELEGRRVSSGFSDKKDGELRSLVVETVGGGEEREVFGTRKPAWILNLVKAPVQLQLSHLSGGEEDQNWALVLHYE